MPEILERGYIYIAQPPLYKVQKGKQERYIKDDPALTEYLTTLALDNSSLHVNEDAPGISDLALENLVKDYQLTESIITRLTRKYPLPLLNALIYNAQIDADDLSNEAAVSQWTNNIVNYLTENDTDATLFSAEVEKDEERNLFFPNIVIRQHGVGRDYILNYEFLTSRDYLAIAKTGSQIANLIEQGGYIRRGEKTREVSNFVDALDWLITESKRGLYIQRYKGLGEMNPGQLWETTMDPEVRRMLKVTIEDAIAADQLFATLMGDQVEPRREFIEQNALKVVNLDV
jgi:DNA gyrase subunit B